MNDKNPFGSGRFVAGALPEFTKVSKKKQKGFLEDNISTGGSIAGALAGGASGAAIGSVVPVVGTAVGGIIGALLGGAAGGGGGQMLENKITGEEDLMAGVGEEALWGGATALPFGAGLKLAGAGAKAGVKALTGGAVNLGKKSAMDLVQEAGIQTMTKGALKKATLDGTLSEGAQAAATRLANKPTLANKLGNKLSDLPNDMAVKRFRLNPGQTTNFKKVHGEDAGKVIRRYGIENIEDVAAKGIEPLQGAFDAVIKDIPDISAKELDSGLRSIYEPLTKSPALFQQQLGAQLKSQADELMKFAGNGTLPASKVNELRRMFDSAVKYTQRGAPDANVAKETADALRGLLQKTADNAGIKAADGKTFKEIGQELSKMYKLDELVSRQGELGRGSLPAGLNLVTGAVLGGSGGGIGGALAGAAGQAVVNSPTSRRLMMGATDKLTGKLLSNAQKDAGQTLKQAATRIGGVGAIRSALGGETADQSSFENSAIAPKNMTDSTNMPMTSNIDAQYAQQPDMSSPLGYSSTQIAQALMKAYAAGDTAAVKQLGGMYELASTFEATQAEANTSSAKPLSQFQQERQDLLTALDNTEGLISRGSINYGPISAPIEDFKSIFNAADPETLSFKNTVSGLRAAIAKARAGASMTDGEKAMLAEYTPSFGDSEQVIMSKLAGLRQLYGYSVPNATGNSDIVSALQQGQY